MTDNHKRYEVDLTEGEAECIERYAFEQGVGMPDFLAYCARAVSLGLNYAVSMLPRSGRSGARED